MVEANERHRLSRIEALLRDGYSVTGVATVEEAIQAVGKETFELLIIGLEQPLAPDRILARISPDTGILMIADADSICSLTDAAGTGIRSFLVPPVSQQRFREKVTHVISDIRQVKNSIRHELLSSMEHVSHLPATEVETSCFFKKIADISAASIDADYVSLMVKDDTNGALVSRSSSGDEQSNWEEVCRETASMRKPVLIHQAMRNHSQLRSHMAEAGISAILSVPLVVRGEAIGALNHIRVKGRTPFNASDINFATALCRLSSMALENTRLYDITRQQYIHSQRLLQEISTAQENERRRMAVEIHDGVAQWMVGASYDIKACSSLAADMKLDDLKRELGIARQATQRSIRELRRTIANLRPLPLEEMGLIAAIRQSTESLAEDGITCHIDVHEDLPRLSVAEETTIYRIVQEILTNIRRHSRASEASVDMRYCNGSYLVEISDNGRGFTPENVINNRMSPLHMGIIGMKERAELLDGYLTIESSPGKGTMIRFSFPAYSREIIKETATVQD